MTTAFCQASPSLSDPSRVAKLRETCSLAEAFDAISAQRATAIAVRSGESEITYTELERQASSIAHALRRRGAGRGSLVAIYLPRGMEMIPAVNTG